MKLVHVFTVPISLNFLRGQAAYMKLRGLSVDVVSSPGRELDAFAIREGSTPHAVEMSRSIKPLHDLQALYRLWRIFRSVCPRIVHSHTPKGGLLGTIAAFFARVPVRIYHIHGLPFVTARGLKRSLLRWTEWISCSLAHQVFCVSPSVREVAIAERLCKAEKVKVILKGSINGVDAATGFSPELFGNKERSKIRERYCIPADALVLGFVGRVVRDKGIVELAESWKRLREAFPSLHLFILGNFETQDPLPADVEQMLRGDPKIHLAGHVEDPRSFFAAMDVIALPTYREGLGMVLLEAAAMELPVVATRIPGCIDAVIDGATGILVPVRDAGALTEAILKYLECPELRTRHGKAGRERILSDFCPEDMWQEVYKEYMHLLRERYQIRIVCPAVSCCSTPEPWGVPSTISSGTKKRPGNRHCRNRA